MNYALIENGKVINIIYLTPSNASDFPNAISCDDLPVGIGDDYTNGRFYRDGKEILSLTEQTYVNSIGDIVDGRTGFTATDNYNLGSLLMIDGEAYETIKAIPRGKTIHINEDVIKTTITKFMEEKE